jgi:hypothetical protein
MIYVNPYYVYVMLEALKVQFDPDGEGVFDGYSEAVEFATAEDLYREFLNSDFNSCEESEHDEIIGFVGSLDKEHVEELVSSNA